MKPPHNEGKPWWKIPVVLSAFVGSSLLFAGLCFGYLHVFTHLPLWACVSVSLPVGILVFMLVYWLHVFSDAPPR